MKHPCAFHPTRTAHWICPKCGSAFCPECIIRREKGGYEKKASIHLCPKCNLPAQWIGISGIIDPFWKRLPKIFLYPFSLQPMLLMLGLAVVEMFFATPGFLNFMIKCVIYCVMLKYAFAAMKATASGDLTPPGLTAEAISEDFGVVFKQYGIYFAIGLLFFFAAAALGPIGGVTALIFLLLSIPAMIILLVTTGRLRNALNPTLFVPLMLRIGWGYLLMYLFLFFLLSAPGAVLRLVLPMFPQALATFVRALAGNFYILVGYHLMGYVLLQYHEEIGYRVDFEQFKDPGASAGPALSDPEDLILKEVAPLIQEGNLNEAVLVIGKYTATRKISGKTLAERYFTLLKMTGKTEELLKFAMTYLDILLRENDRGKLVQAYSACQAASSGFLPSPPVLTALAEEATGKGKSETAIRLYSKIIKEYPQDPLAPKAYFRAAQIFHDRLMNRDKARQIIEALLKKYPESDIAPKAQDFLSQLS